MSTLFADTDTWNRLPTAAKTECVRTDHGTFRCTHHTEPYPPYLAAGDHQASLNRPRNA